MSAANQRPPAEWIPPGAKKTKQIKSKPVRRKDKRPILRGFHAVRMIYVPRPWCDRFHTHGWEPEDDAGVITARVAHGKHGPVAPGFYWISVFRESELEQIEGDLEWGSGKRAKLYGTEVKN